MTVSVSFFGKNRKKKKAPSEPGKAGKRKGWRAWGAGRHLNNISKHETSVVGSFACFVVCVWSETSHQLCRVGERMCVCVLGGGVW